MREWLRMPTRRPALAAAVMFVLSIGGPALAIARFDEGALPFVSEEGKDHLHHQHGDIGGHLPASSTSNIELIGKMRINQDQAGRVADVGVLGTTAYLAAWAAPDCQKGGVYVFDIANPAAPKQINFIRTGTNSYSGEGIHAIRLSTSQWTGDLLAFNNEDCTNKSQDPKFLIGKTSKHSVGGATFVDVSNPKVHRYLAEGFGDRTQGVLGAATEADAHEIHSIFVWEDENGTPGSDGDDTAYAVIVDNEEEADLDILDITNPAAPVLIAEYDLDATFPQIVDHLGTAEAFHHDVIVKKIDDDYVMLVSYWDGGYVALDVNDPTAPTYIGDTDHPIFDEVLDAAVDPDPNLPPEGNAHEAEFSLDNQYIVAADEDFDAFKPFISIDGGAPAGFSAGAATGPLLGSGESLSGGTRFAGVGCDPATFPAADASASIAVIERGTCGFQAKLDNASNAGYEAGIIMNSTTGSPSCESLVNMLATTDIYSFFVSRSVGYAILDIGGYNPANCPEGANPDLPASGTDGLPIELSVKFDGWGYVRLFDYESGEMTELDTYAIPEAHDVNYAVGFGDLSVHEVAMSETWSHVAYFSYYSAGFRVVEIEGDQLVEKGHFVDEGGNNFWGVQVWQFGGEEYVLASDRDFGVYIFKYNPED